MPAEPAWTRYRNGMIAILPSAQGDELRYRCGICLLRDNASTALTKANDIAIPLLVEVQRMGIDYAHSNEKHLLKPVWSAMLGMFSSARRLNEACNEVRNV